MSARVTASSINGRSRPTVVGSDSAPRTERKPTSNPIAPAVAPERPLRSLGRAGQPARARSVLHLAETARRCHRSRVSCLGSVRRMGHRDALLSPRFDALSRLRACLALAAAACDSGSRERADGNRWHDFGYGRQSAGVERWNARPAVPGQSGWGSSGTGNRRCDERRSRRGRRFGGITTPTARARPPLPPVPCRRFPSRFPPEPPPGVRGLAAGAARSSRAGLLRRGGGPAMARRPQRRRRDGRADRPRPSHGGAAGRLIELAQAARPARGLKRRIRRLQALLRRRELEAGRGRRAPDGSREPYSVRRGSQMVAIGDGAVIWTKPIGLA